LFFVSLPPFVLLTRLLHSTHLYSDALAPLLGVDAEGEKTALVSMYFQAHDALAVLRAQGEAADAVLARQLKALSLSTGAEAAMDTDMGMGRGGLGPLAPVALVLALHVLHRLVQRCVSGRGFRPPVSLDQDQTELNRN
jgi:prolyl-tRNA editing enzyme YbaK/EbsC (Cys-tRNA(Pro) deacylase)